MPAAKRQKGKPKKPLLIHFPVEVINQLNALAEKDDTDRSKLIRKAVRLMIRNSA
jgi:metal-responsive CopG/Arc/MetJ family transcriptional regulator